MKPLRLANLLRRPVWIASCAIALLASASMAFAQPAPARAGTLDHIKQSGKIRLGYMADARPLSYKDEAGNAAGFAVALCGRVADAAKAQLGMAELTVEWVPVTLDGRFKALQQGEIDVLCAAGAASLARRSEVSFSIPIFPGGIGAVLRTDAPARLREVLSGHKTPFRPLWRGSVDQALQERTFSVIAGTSSEKWLASRIHDLQVTAKIVPVESHEAGIRGVLDRSSNVFFDDRTLLLEAAKRSPSHEDLIVLDSFFTYDPFAFALARGDEDFRVVADRALSRFYRSGEIGALYAKWCGEPSENVLAFFRLNALPE